MRHPDDKNKNILAQQYCPGQGGSYTLQVRRQRVIIGYQSGQVLIFGFEEERDKAVSLRRSSRLL